MFPQEIVADRQRGCITVVWDDGHRSEYRNEMLRWACPCATCAGEWGRPGLLSELQSLPADEFRLQDVRAVGSYAIAPIWGSGHNTGIYTFEYLRSICDCQMCGEGGSVKSADEVSGIPDGVADVD